MGAPAESSARDLVLLWCLWLLGSWLVSGLGGWQVAAPRWMVFASLTGFMLMWPALRLGQDLGWALSAGVVLWDWFCLNLVFQAVVWPLQVSAEWTLAQALWLDGALAGWSLLTGLVLVGVGRWTSPAGRVAAMGLCLLLVLGEPLLLAIMSLARLGAVWPMWISPIDTVWALTEEPARIWPPHVAGVMAVAAAGWLLVVLLGAGPPSADRGAPARIAGGGWSEKELM